MTRQSVIWRAIGLIWAPLGVLGLCLCFLSTPVSAAKPAAEDQPQAETPSAKSLSRKSEATAERPTAKKTADKPTRVTPESKVSRRPVKTERGKTGIKVAKGDQADAVELKDEAADAAVEQKEGKDIHDKVKHIIGTTAAVIEAQSQLLFHARVDTGATSCSVHFEEMEVEDESKKMEDNVGKSVRVLLNNGADQTTWVESKIERCVTVKTSEEKERRYKVPMTFRLDGVEKTVVVTLNDRGHMRYPLLLGRNFLKGDFLVDAELNSGD